MFLALTGNVGANERKAHTITNETWGQIRALHVAFVKDGACSMQPHNVCPRCSVQRYPESTRHTKGVDASQPEPVRNTQGPAAV